MFYILYLDIQCVSLAPSVGLEMLCFDGTTYTTGVGYEGDTCSFTCNTGYELTGGDTRTCFSSSRRSGSKAMCRRGEYCLFVCGYPSGKLQF